MKTTLPLAFDTEPLILPPDRLLPSRPLPKQLDASRKFKQIKASIQEVGIIEPIAVSGPDRKTGLYLVLDGHLRMHAAQQLGLDRLPCLVARDDEGFTYNKRINRLATVQEHYMILRSLERGVSEERLARALDVNIQSIRRKRDLLDGICSEVVDMLKEQNFSADMMRHLRKMKPPRQIECADLMLSLNNFSTPYAAALLAATPPEQLCEPERPKKFLGVSSEQMARMEREMASVQSRFKAVELSYGTDVLNFVMMRGYVSKLITNASATRFMQQYYPEFLEEFRSIAAMSTLDDKAPRAIE